MRDTAFLHGLLMGVNEQLHTDRRLRWFQFAAIVSDLQAPLRELRAGPREPVTLARVAPLVVEIRAQAQAVAIIAERYFAGREIRFADLAADQTLLLEQLTAALGLYEEAVAFLAEAEEQTAADAAAAYPPLDHAPVARSTARLAAGVVASWIDLAKAEAHRFMDQPSAAAAILAPYIGGGDDGRD